MGVVAATLFSWVVHRKSILLLSPLEIKKRASFDARFMILKLWDSRG
jgi:hypothetical protein